MEKQFKLPKEFADKWLKALRSGDYSQTQGVLHDKDDNGYCCIGVAGSICGISDKSMNNSGLFTDEDFTKFKINSFKKKGLPVEFLEDNPLMHTLSDMNDRGKTFEKIADWVEKNVEFY